MIKTPIDLQELRRRIYHKAKAEPTHRFWGIFTHITEMTTLQEAYKQAKKNGGVPGIDGQSFADVEQEGVIPFLESIQAELQAETYTPQANRKVDIPKANGKTRTLQIPCIRDRVVQGALKLILEAIFEADFCPNSYGFRPKRSPHQALAEVRRSLLRRMTTVVDVDLTRYFDTNTPQHLAGENCKMCPRPASHASRKAGDQSGWENRRTPRWIMLSFA